VLKCHQEQGTEAVTEEVGEGTEMAVGQDMAGTDRALQGEEGFLEVEADLLDKTEVYLTSALAVEVLIRKKMKVYLREGLGVGPEVMIDQTEEIVATADNQFVIVKIMCRDLFFIIDFKFITQLHFINCFRYHFK